MGRRMDGRPPLTPRAPSRTARTLPVMARKLVVEIIGDDTSLRKALDRSSKEAKQQSKSAYRTSSQTSGFRG